MAYTTGKDVSVGDATKETHHDTLSSDQDWLRANLDVDHDFDASLASGAGGYHRADADSPLHIKNADGTPKHMSVALHVDGNGDYWLLMRTGDQSSVTNANADGYIKLEPVPAGGIPA